MGDGADDGIESVNGYDDHDEAGQVEADNPREKTLSN